MKSKIVYFVCILFATSLCASTQQELLQDIERNPEAYGIHKNPPFHIKLFKLRTRVEALSNFYAEAKAKLERDLKIEKALEEGKSVKPPADFIPTKDLSKKLQSRISELRVAASQLKEMLDDPAAKKLPDNHINAAMKALTDAETLLKETDQGT